MITANAKELVDIADDVNNPDNLKIDIDYEQFTYNFSKSLREWSKQGKYYIVIGFSNYHIGLDEVEEYDIHHTEYLKKYTDNQLLDFVERFLDDLHGKGYYISYKFSGNYGTDLIRVLKISWKDDMNEQVAKPSFFKRITNFFG